MRLHQQIVFGAIVLAITVPASAQAKTFEVFRHPNATAAPTKPVAVKDLQGSAPPANDLERIVGADSPAAVPVPAPAPAAVPAPAPEHAVPDLLPPLHIIPPPSELLASLPATEPGLLSTMQDWAKHWYALIQVGTMFGLFVFSAVLCLTGRKQYALLRRSVGAAEVAAQAARQSAESAQLSAIMQPAMERPYVFLEPNIQGSVSSEGENEPAQFTIKFAFRNHGRTPAIIADLQASGSYWSAGYPDTLFATSHTASQGMIISSGERSAPFTLVFNVSIADLQEAYGGNGQLLFWGKLLYRDMFSELRETAFCRCYRFDEKAFRMAQAEKLNYHT
jgi:hypothetical protein